MVHLVAEASALGNGALTSAFVLRHLYLGVLVLVSLAVFARTAGFGRPRAELRRRVALIGSLLRGRRAPGTIVALVTAELSFFVLTQLGEGIPVLSGDLALGFALGVLGSLLAGLVLATVGRGVAAAAACGLVRRIAPPAPAPTFTLAPAAPPRSAAAAFSLFVPNRPPPFPPLT